jgi:hypothetical protein
VAGVYDERVNAAEAGHVVKLVRELLKRSEPPSIGIACFNIDQRDRIIEALNEAAADDETFAARLAEARNRRSNGAFEGLFVRNLENVQGDERDYLIISTTYGPDPNGRFYRRFGPLGRPGGGRRLNVLVTRAREEVHLVSSIPPEVYRGLPTLPPGTVPTGAWLLFDYLKYAEELERLYKEQPQPGAEEGAVPKGAVEVQQSAYPSAFAGALADRLAAEHGLSSTVYWGNDGFCVDVALRHPQRADDVTIGVLCDLCRFAKADDLVEWDVFRTAVLQSQGWQLYRLWTPQFFRDSKGITDTIMASARKALDRDRGDPLALLGKP